MKKKPVGLLLTAVVLFTAGCVKRTIVIESDPSGAQVWINEHPMGSTPVTYEFITHGRYKFRLEKSGFRERVVRERVMAPIYEWIPLDFIFEVLIPFHLNDRHPFRYTLEPLSPEEQLKTDEPTDRPGILAHLESPDPVQRRAACVALARLRDPSTAAAAESATRDPVPSVRVVALEAFRAIGGRGSLPCLVKALREDRVQEVRWQAAIELEALKSKEAVPALIAALKDRSHLVRAGAAEALKGIPDPRSVQPLIRTLRDKDTTARRAAAEALGLIGDPAAVRPLMNTLFVHDFQTRRRAAKSLSHLKDPSSGPALVRALNDWDPQIRNTATAALIQFGGPGVVPLLIRYLHSWKPTVRQHAALVLSGLKDLRAAEPLARAFRREDNLLASRAMLAALQSLGAGMDMSWKQMDLWKQQESERSQQEQRRRRKGRGS